MADEKEKIISKSSDRPTMIDLNQNHTSENIKSSPEERIKLAINYLFEQQKALQHEQQQAHSELHNARDQLKNAQEQLETSLNRLNDIQNRLVKKSNSLEKLISEHTSFSDKQTLANAIIISQESDL